MTAQPQTAVHPLAIGGVRLENNLVLGPMAGVCEPPFRLLCREAGAGLVCMEMVSAKAICYRNRNTEKLLEVLPEERPVSLQLFGSDPASMAEAARAVEDRPWDILDINMGCPVPKVFKNGDGSALMADPLLAGRVIEAVVKAVQKPVTVKIRKGIDEAHANACEIAHIAEESGAKAVAVHGRTREQYYSGRADWDIIRRVKETVGIPVIGNGDLNTPEDILRMHAETGCDGFMIARGARGNPWIFSRLLAYFETGELPPPPAPREIADRILAHARMQVACDGETAAIRKMRKHTAWYVSGMRNASRLRGQINEIDTYARLEELLSQIVAAAEASGSR